jgi:thiol:disulfide interchange protein
MLSYFFWIKGIFKSKNSDMILGLILLASASLLSIVLIHSSGAFNFVGAFLIVFGIISFIFKNKIDESKNIKFTENRIRDYGGVAFIIGILWSLVA